jgi:3-methyl-2-oxobutanoate hydroxymethyltransferase
VRALTEHGMPVCAHLGLTPQSVHQLGGYRVQGRDADAAGRLLEDARLLDDAGAGALVLECIPSALAAQITAGVSMPTIGIGAGLDCDGQVLVLYDLLGITPGKRPVFSRNFLEDAADIPQALQAYVKAVKDGSFPGPEHSFD